MNWHKWKIRLPWILFTATAFSLIGYLAYSASVYALGFPLDDAWIHQTYARNLIATGRWVFSGDTVSGGSTGPFWTMILSLGYLLHLQPIIWAYLMGGSALFCIAMVCIRWYRIRSNGSGLSSLALGMLILFEWHLVWAALSGMETIVAALLPAVVFLLLQPERDKFGGAGLLMGLGMWIRPDVILLFIPAVFLLVSKFFQGAKVSMVVSRGLRLLGGFLAIFIPYLIFNYFSAGTIWPTTFFAKQAEYEVLTQEPFLLRTIKLLEAPLAGLGIILFPGMLLELIQVLKQKRYEQLAPFLWVAAYVGAYALKLPVTYQHGRYLMPVLPVSIVLAFLGFQEAQSSLEDHPRYRILHLSWKVSIILVLIIFWFLGAQAYSVDVAIIESEMVAAARWVRQNTPDGAKIAAHDIGAMGYFSDRELFDLAGLVSPEVIPIIRDEQALQQLLDREGVEYLVTFPGWYPYLSTIGEKEFATGGGYSPAQGGENMTVYRWP